MKMAPFGLIVVLVLFFGAYDMYAMPAFAASTSSVPSTHIIRPRVAPASSHGIAGIITAIGTHSFTLQPQATDGDVDPAPVTITVASSTRIVMRGDTSAALSNLAVGYTVLYLHHPGYPAAVLVSPKDSPVEAEAAPHEQAQ